MMVMIIMVMRNDIGQNTCLRMMVLCSVLWSRRVAGPGWIFCPKKQQNKYTRWKVKVVEKHKREKCKNNGTFPWQKSGEAEGGLDLGDKLFFPQVKNNTGEEGSLL